MAGKETIPVTIEVRAQCNCGRWRFDKDAGGYVSDNENMGILAIGGQCTSCGDNLTPICSVALSSPKRKRKVKRQKRESAGCQEATEAAVETMPEAEPVTPEPEAEPL